LRAPAERGDALNDRPKIRPGEKSVLRRLRDVLVLRLYAQANVVRAASCFDLVAGDPSVRQRHGEVRIIRDRHADRVL